MQAGLKKQLVELVKFGWKEGEEHPLEEVVDAVEKGLHQLNYRIVPKGIPEAELKLERENKYQLTVFISEFVKKLKVPPKDMFPSEEMAVQILKNFAPKKASKK